MKGKSDIPGLYIAVENLQKEVEKLKSLLYAAKEVLNLEEAAVFLGISKSSLYKMTHNQVVPFYKPNNKMVYFEKSELLKWLRQNPVASQTQISEEAQTYNTITATNCLSPRKPLPKHQKLLKRKRRQRHLRKKCAVNGLNSGMTRLPMSSINSSRRLRIRINSWKVLSRSLEPLQRQ